MFASAAERFDDGWVDFGSGEGIAGGNVCEAHERMHERCHRFATLSPMAVMMRAGSRALRMTTTRSGLARSKYGSTNSSRRPFGASTIGMLCFAARCLTQH